MKILLRIIRQFHANNIKVVLDAVFNRHGLKLKSASIELHIVRMKLAGYVWQDFFHLVPNFRLMIK